MSLQSEFIAPAQLAAGLTPEELNRIMMRARAERGRATREMFGAIGNVLARIFARGPRHGADVRTRPA